MRIDPRFGSDTGVWVVDVLIDTPAELPYTDEQIECIARGALEAQRIDWGAVADLSVRVRNGRGDWVPATRAADGKLAPVSW